MGALGSCLGVGRPDVNQPNGNLRLIGTNLVNSVSGQSERNMLRYTPTNQKSVYLPNRINMTPNGKNLITTKLSRQSSTLSAQNNGQLLPPYNGQSNGLNNSSQIVPKLVDFDDNPASPFDKPVKQSSQLICNNRTKHLQQNNGNANMIGSHNFNLNMQENGISASSLIAKTAETSPHNIVNLVALYDLNPTNKEDLSLIKGEHLETVPSLMKDKWWVARSKASGLIGYIPSNYVGRLDSFTNESWFSSQIGRVQAENLLKKPENKDGTFLVRRSESNKHHYSLSVKHAETVKHYKIKHEASEFYISEKKRFSSLHDLVAHYTNSQDGLCINLRAACPIIIQKPVISSIANEIRDKWEIDKSELSVFQELGRGQFGQVFEGLHIKTGTRVAIKTLRKDSMPLQDFLAEAQIMKKMNHPNLVELFAVCTREEPVYIITELMSKGALINYLQTNEGRNLPPHDYINMATQIAYGMSYLEHENYVHRDLAARNILVGDDNICKIADFGLARFITESAYEAHAGAKFPIKWTAPEAANFSKFTIKSDVWSFGIVLYEIITKGGTPYPDMSNAEVLNRIDNGYRMPQPPGCENKYFTIMSSCWHKDPVRRPTFDTLYCQLSNYATSDEQYREASQFRER